jgi:hypothetical protein
MRPLDKQRLAQLNNEDASLWRASSDIVGPTHAENRGPAMSDEDLKDELERLRKENAALKKGASSPIRMKVSEKGAVSIYGMGRFPVTL